MIDKAELIGKTVVFADNSKLAESLDEHSYDKMYVGRRPWWLWGCMQVVRTLRPAQNALGKRGDSCGIMGVG